MSTDVRADGGSTPGTRRFSTRDILTVLVIFGCSAMIIGVAVIALSGQKLQVDIGDGGFLSGEPCGPPCFLGIRPGLTRSSDARSVLKAPPFSGDCVEADTSINCREVIQVGFQDETVNMVSFKPTTQITASDLLGRYGPPDRALAFVSSLMTGGPPTSKMRLFYDGLSAMIDFPDQRGTDFTLGSETPISNIAYLSEGEYSSYQAQIAERVSAWEGFKTYPAQVEP